MNGPYAGELFFGRCFGQGEQILAGNVHEAPGEPIACSSQAEQAPVIEVEIQHEIARPNDSAVAQRHRGSLIPCEAVQEEPTCAHWAQAPPPGGQLLPAEPHTQHSTGTPTAGTPKPEQDPREAMEAIALWISRAQ